VTDPGLDESDTPLEIALGLTRSVEVAVTPGEHPIVFQDGYGPPEFSRSIERDPFGARDVVL
jgi:hypothetical protein